MKNRMYANIKDAKKDFVNLEISWNMKKRMKG